MDDASKENGGITSFDSTRDSADPDLEHLWRQEDQIRAEADQKRYGGSSGDNEDGGGGGDSGDGGVVICLVFFCLSLPTCPS